MIILRYFVLFLCFLSFNALGADILGNKLPSCDDASLHQQVRQFISEQNSLKKDNTILENRQQALLLKNLTSFTEIALDAFSPAQNYDLADRLLELKINQGIDSQGLRICRSTNTNKDIYLLIYPDLMSYSINVFGYSSKPLLIEYKF